MCLVNFMYIVFSANRIVVYGDEMYKAVVPGSAKAFNFQRAYRLSDDIVRHFDILHESVELRSVTKLEHSEVHRLISLPSFSSNRFITCFFPD